MKNECGLITMAMATGLVANAQTNQKTETPNPNVVIILADDLGYGDLECYGAKNVETPNVNRLANNGIKFTNGHAVASTSTPSRYSLLTGEYAWRRPDTDIANGDAAMIIRPEQYTMADMFRSAGYKTGAIGKWHLGLGDKSGKQDWNNMLAAGVNDLGFDYSYIMAATADRVPCVFIENGMVANWDPENPIEVNYKSNFPGEPTGRDNPELLYNLKPSHGHDQAIVNGISRIGYMKGGGSALWKDENIADSIVAKAVQFIDDNKDQPFFLYFATNDVHVPRFPHDRFRGKNKMGLRGDAIAQFDWTVGQIVDALERDGILDNTLIVVTSDNGPVTDDGYDDKADELLNGHTPAGNLRGGKYSAFEGGTTVPVIVHWPAGIKNKGESDALISQVDWLTSFASLVGTRMPKDVAPDSFDNLTTLIGMDKNDRNWVVEQAGNHTLSLVSDNWKYIEGSNGGPLPGWGPKIETGYLDTAQLYDMSQPGEKTNVALQNPEKVLELEKILRKVKNGDYKRK